MTIDIGAASLALIPARGGSKGIPQKNLLNIAGKPLIAWTIEAVAEAREPFRCVVSTDDAAISQVAIQLGAEVVSRPKELATDQSPTEPSLLHALDHLRDLHDYEPTEVMLLQPTSPVRRKGTIDAALRRFRDSNATSLVSVTHEHPFLWRGPLDTPTPLYEVNSRPRRQDLSDDQRCYRETGSIYITTTSGLRTTKNRISGRVVLFVLSEEESGDIDTREDVAAATSVLEGVKDADRS